jgi:hypothetical protein
LEVQFIEASAGIHEQIAFGAKAIEYINGFEQGGVLHDQAIGSHHRLPEADLLVVDAAERYHGSPGALRTEARECLSVLAIAKRRD